MESKVKEALKDKYGEIQEIEAAHSGHEKDVFAFKAGAEKLVVSVYKKVENIESRAIKEMKILSYLATQQINVPQIVFWEEKRSLKGFLTEKRRINQFIHLYCQHCPNSG